MTPANPLQKFVKKPSPYRFLKLALKLRAPEPAYHHVLIMLADHADGDDASGVCWPSHKTLMAETGYLSKNTIVCALKYWKDAGVLNWKKGWGNAHVQNKHANVYRFNEDVMRSLVAQQGVTSSTNSGEVLAQTLGPDEETLRGEAQTLGADEQTPDLPLRAKQEGLSSKGLSLEGGSANSLNDGPSTSRQNPTKAHVEEQPIGVSSYEQPIRVPSSGTTYASLVLDPRDGLWVPRHGCVITDADVAEMQRLNARP
jgi:hypothetical protein